MDGGIFPRVYEVGESPRFGAALVAWYVMDRIAGETLRQGLRDRSRLRLDWTAAFIGLLDDLMALGRRVPGFHHGDLKPENILTVPSTLDGTLARESGAEAQLELRNRFRVVDPALRLGAHPRVRTTRTKAYSRAGLSGESADTASIAIMIREILAGQAPSGSPAESGGGVPASFGNAELDRFAQGLLASQLGYGELRERLESVRGQSRSMGAGPKRI